MRPAWYPVVCACVCVCVWGGDGGWDIFDCRLSHIYVLRTHVVLYTPNAPQTNRLTFCAQTKHAHHFVYARVFLFGGGGQDKIPAWVQPFCLFESVFSATKCSHPMQPIHKITQCATEMFSC